jgi:hypothetical protein
MESLFEENRRIELTFWNGRYQPKINRNENINWCKDFEKDYNHE